MTALQVHLDGPDRTIPVGTARIDRLRGTDTTELTYDVDYLRGPGWAVSPDVPTDSSRHVIEGLPGALEDSTPDAWGRNLIVRRQAARARDQGHPPPMLGAIDFLLGASDRSRQGALRYRLSDDGSFLAATADIPQLVALDDLMAAAAAVESTTAEADDAAAHLLQAGSGSLGGARPKASVLDGSTLLLAKFPQADDPYDVLRWEAVALDLAEMCGVRTPPHRLIEVGAKVVLVLERFDRLGPQRLPYLSARSLIQARDGDRRDYLEILEGITEHGSDVDHDLRELWRRVALSIVLNNTDDHLRNHGLVRTGPGWTLAPVFDVNPDPRPHAPRTTSLGGAVEPGPSHEALLSTSERFGLGRAEAERAWNDIVDTARGWRSIASRRGLDRPAQDRFAPVLDRWSR